MARTFSLPNKTGHALQYLRVKSDESGYEWANAGGGGGGITIGDVVTGGTPTEVLYTDNSGDVYSDALFTRDSSTNISNFARQVTADLIQGFQITDSLLGALDFTGNYTTDTLANTSAFVGVADLTAFMQSATTAIVGAMDSSGNFQTMTVAPNGVNAGYTNGVVDSTWTLSPSVARMRFDNGSGNEADVFLNSSEAYLRYDDGVNDYQMGADTNGFFWEYNGTKQRLPTGVAPAAGRVLTSTIAGSAWLTPTSAPAGSDTNIQFNNGGAMGGTNNFTYSDTTGMFAMYRVADGQLYASIDPLSNSWSFGAMSGDNSTPYLTMDGNTRKLTYFGYAQIQNGNLVYTPSGTPGLNDVSFSGTWDGQFGPATYTAVVDVLNNSYFTYSGLVGSGFVRGDTIEAYAGVTLLATGTVTGGSSGYPVANALIADFGGIDVSAADNVVDTTNGSTATVTFNYLVDTLNWTVDNSSGPAITTFGLPCNPTPYYTQGGLGLIAAAYTGHTVGDQWEQTFDFGYGSLIEADGDDGTIHLGDLDSVKNGIQLWIEDNNQRVVFGDVLGVNNATAFDLRDSTSLITARTAGAFRVSNTNESAFYFNVNIASNSYFLGNPTGMKLDMVGSNSRVTLGDITTASILYLEGDNGVTRLGDVGAIGNGTLITTDDPAELITFQGNIALNKTITPPLTTGDQTINTTSGSVNFAAAQASVTVTSSIANTTSVIVATVATQDATFKNCSIDQSTPGEFTIYADVAPTAETRVNFIVTN